MDTVTAVMEGPTSQKSVDIAQNDAKQSLEILAPLVQAVETLRAQIKAAPSQ